MLIRQVQPEDAEQLLRLQLQLDKETKFMLHEHGERKTTVEEQRQQIETMLVRGGMIFVAEHEAGLVGYLGTTTYPLRRIRHGVTIVIGILQAFAHPSRNWYASVYCSGGMG